MLLAYSKIVHYDELLAGPPDDPALQHDLVSYFPRGLGDASRPPSTATGCAVRSLPRWSSTT